MKVFSEVQYFVKLEVYKFVEFMNSYSRKVQTYAIDSCRTYTK